MPNFVLKGAIAALIGTFLFFSPVFAQGHKLEITSNNKLISETSLFSVENFAPAQEISEKIKVKNISPEPQKVICKINKKNSTGLEEALIFSIKNNLTSEEIYSSGLNNTFNKEIILANNLMPDHQATLNFSIYFEDVGNEYQNEKVEFEIALGTPQQEEQTVGISTESTQTDGTEEEKETTGTTEISQTQEPQQETEADTVSPSETEEQSPQTQDSGEKQEPTQKEAPKDSQKAGKSSKDKEADKTLPNTVWSKLRAEAREFPPTSWGLIAIGILSGLGAIILKKTKSKK